MNHSKGETVFDTSINRETFADILEQNELFTQQYNNEINVTKDDYSKKKITEQYINDLNNKLNRELQINPINITNDDYTTFYDSNGIVLIPSHTQYINSKKETVYLSKYSGMNKQIGILFLYYQIILIKNYLTKLNMMENTILH